MSFFLPEPGWGGGVGIPQSNVAQEQKRLAPTKVAVWLLSRSPSSALSHPFLGEGSPARIDYRKKGTLILTSLLEDLVVKRTKQIVVPCSCECQAYRSVYASFWLLNMSRCSLG